MNTKFANCELLSTNSNKAMTRVHPLPDGRLFTVAAMDKTHVNGNTLPHEQFLFGRISEDGGRSWGAPFHIYTWPEKRAAMLHAGSMVDSRGHLHVFALRIRKPLDGGIGYVRFDNCNGENPIYSKMPCLDRYTGSLNNCLETANGRLVIPFSTITGQQDSKFVSSVIYSDDWGKTWSQAKPTKITTSNAPGSFTRLPDGRIFLTWNNDMGHPMQAVRYSFARQCLHGAVSDDNLKTLQGARILLKKTPGDPNRVLNCYPYTTMANEREIFLRTFEVEGKGNSKWGQEQAYLTKLNPDFLAETHVSDNWQEWVCDTPVTEEGVTLRITSDNTAYAITSFPYGTSGKLVIQTEGTMSQTCRILLSDCYLDRLNFMKNSRPNQYDESIHMLYHSLTPTETGVWEILWKDGSITLSVNGTLVQTVPMTASAGLNHAAILFTDAGELKVTHFEAQIDDNRWDTGIEY